MKFALLGIATALSVCAISLQPYLKPDKVEPKMTVTCYNYDAAIRWSVEADSVHFASEKDCTVPFVAYIGKDSICTFERDVFVSY